MHAAKLGISGVSVLNYTSATLALDTCDDAIATVSATRSRIGAYVNRLEHVIVNLNNTSENVQAAESLIRDSDMASLMVEYAKDNILLQAGQSMLAQANQMNKDVLALLQ